MKNFFKHNLAILKSKLTNMEHVMDIEKHKEFDLLKEEVEKVGQQHQSLDGEDRRLVLNF